MHFSVLWYLLIFASDFVLTTKAMIPLLEEEDNSQQISSAIQKMLSHLNNSNIHFASIASAASLTHLHVLGKSQDIITLLLQQSSFAFRFVELNAKIFNLYRHSYSLIFIDDFEAAQ